MPLKYVNMLCLHGIATGALEQETYYKRWQLYINEELEGQTVQVKTLGLHWDSSGDAIKDLTTVLSSRVFREKQLASIEEQLLKVIDYVDVIVTHSLGCSWIMPILSRLQRPSPPLIGLGGPMGHPIWRKPLEWTGLHWGEKRDFHQGVMPVHFWNQDDGVAAWNTFYVAPDGWTSTRIAVPGSGTIFKEHVDKDYLTHPLFLRALTD